MKSTVLLGIVSAGVLAGAGGAWAQAPAEKPAIAQVCKSCHKINPGQVQGIYENVAFKSKSIQIKIDNHTEILRFDEKTLRIFDADEERPGADLAKIAKNRESRVDYVDKDGVKYATIISFKGPIKVAPEKLVKYADVKRLVDLGPEKGGYTLVDSRPPPRFQEGAIPTAVNIPYPAFDKFLDRLPADKSRLLVFYCQGITCTMSPKSMQRVEAMGYTNAKVYREGMPEWFEKSYGVLSPKFLKEAWIDKKIPHVLLDVRPAGEIARTGHIPGAVALPGGNIKTALKAMPDRKLKAPVMVYDGRDGEEAVAAAKALVAGGYTGVNVITGGLAGWQAAGYAPATDPVGTKIAYQRMPRPGEIAPAEFAKLARNTPPDVLILDVRNRDEASAGMIKGALLVPDEDLLDRVGEVPKDKKIVAHCLTGVRAEMAYHKLKDKGYDVRFLNAEIDVKGNGDFKVTPK
jgi:rhodanese-related sulfurtransferase